MSITPSIETLARYWVEAFRKAPKITVIATILGMTISFASIYLADMADKERREATRLENLNYQTQIQQLDQTEKGIKALLSFIKDQKQNIRESEDALASLREEQESLKPIVESDRKVVAALFKAQEERNKANVWRERWIGFGFGVAASLVATFIWFVMRLFIVQRNNA
jgi:hypothetical protein